jgi:hypothetical protein
VDDLLLPGGPLRTAPPVPVARVEQLMGLCDTLEAKLKAALVERARRNTWARAICPCQRTPP